MRHVPAFSLQTPAKLCDALNLPFEAILTDVGIDLGLLNMPDARLPAEQFVRLHDAILQQSGHEDFGLLCGRITYMESFHLYMSLAVASTTFRDWINLIPSLTTNMEELFSVVVKRRAEYLILEVDFAVSSQLHRCLVTDMALASTTLLMDGFCVLPVRPVRVDFKYPRPANTTALNDMFRAPLNFGCKSNALYYHKDILDYPQLHVATKLYENVQEELDEFLNHFSWRADSFTTNLYTVIRRQLATGECTVPEVAGKLNISSRTLQLRLQERNTQFRAIVQQVRSALAARYLRQQELSVLDVALLLGYRDPASFSTAFKTWHGSSPREYRKTVISSR